MSTIVSSSPPAHIYKGELGPELVVLSVSVVRIAQRAEIESVVETADGPVQARVGDFILTTAEGDRYPIPASVFFGTYQILGGVGTRFVGRRLLHARRAWEVLSANAEFDYGPGRGKIAAPKGGWIYRSDENDYGYINPEAKGKAHIEVGTVAELNGVDWDRQFRRAAWVMTWLSPAMTLIALLAYSAGLNGNQLISQVLLGIEGVILVASVAVVWWIRREKWVLKSALAVGTEVAAELQSAVQLLGKDRSQIFPSMALWRAAQGDRTATQMFLPDILSSLKDQVSRTYERVRQDISVHRTTETHATLASWVAVGVILFCIAYAIWLHSLFSELLAIWLPSAVGALHSTVIRRQLVRRIGAGKEFLSELAFVRSQLFALVPDDKLDPDDHQRSEVLDATLRVLCRAAAEHTQHQLQFAVSEVLEIPL